MPFCPNCSKEVLVSDPFCRSCGTVIGGVNATGSGQQISYGMLQTLPFKISLRRVIVMSILSYGLYIFYWFYLTWRQYRDHTNSKVFPVWHTLALLVPIYAWFQIYAHIRSFNELMDKAGLSDTIKWGLAVTLFAISNSLDWQSLQASFGETTQDTVVLITIFNVLSIAVTTLLLFYLQGKLNRYWSSLTNVTLVDTKRGVGEVVFAVIGVLFWFDTIAELLSPTFRSL